jgi:hypothetical protein
VAKRTAAKRKVARRKRPAAQRSAAERAPLADLFEAMPVSDDGAAATSDFSLHDLFQQQTMAMLDRSDLSEEQKQSILVAMNCPCCGGSGLSFTMKLKRKK